MSVDEYFETRPANDRAIYDAVARCLQRSGDVTIEAVSVGILFKCARTFAELRPKRVGMRMWFVLSRTVEDERIVRAVKASAHRTAHVVDLATARDVDRDVKAWLTEAFACSVV